MFNSLAEYFRPFIQQIIKTQTAKPTKADLEKVSKDIRLHIVNTMSDLWKEYRALIKLCYRNQPPFNNHNFSPDDDKNFQKDIDDFYHLVIYAWEANDLSILDEFAINLPFDKPDILVRDDKQEYIRRFEFIVSKWDKYMEALAKESKEVWPEEIKPYWSYLLNKFSARMPNKALQSSKTK